MSDDTHNDETRPVLAESTPTAPAADAAAPEPAGSGRRGFRERLRILRRSEDGSRTYGLAALIASALAGIIVGGLGTAALHAVTHDGPGERGGWVQREGRGPGFDGRRGGMHGGMDGGPPGVPGQVPPSTAPEDEGSAS